jgi:hypothetical protein
MRGYKAIHDWAEALGQNTRVDAAGQSNSIAKL